MTVFLDEHRTKKGTLTASSEALLRTANGGQDLELILPKGHDTGSMPPMVTLLAGVLFRVHEDPQFIIEMGKWIEDNWPEESDIN